MKTVLIVFAGFTVLGCFFAYRFWKKAWTEKGSEPSLEANSHIVFSPRVKMCCRLEDPQESYMKIAVAALAKGGGEGGCCKTLMTDENPGQPLQVGWRKHNFGKK